MKATVSITKADARPPAAASLKARKEALERGERVPARVFRVEKRADGTCSRVRVNPEVQRRKSAKAWAAKSEVAKVRQTLNLTQEAFADLLGVGLSTLRSWEQRKREPSGAARRLIAIALRHPEVLREAVA
ncbi:MAG: type II toxin-antitoxin system MqsA family antitoxin [Verrucomicrobia bacterium]|nr:type II toxin-antitoxin system MqsA family antitoxin [Verrucomicrobiota bacterium]